MGRKQKRLSDGLKIDGKSLISPAKSHNRMHPVFALIHPEK